MFGEEHSEVAGTLNNLGNAWCGLGENRKAIGFYEQALAIKRKVFGEEDLEVASTLNNLGNAWDELGEKRKAIKLFKQALAIYRKTYGEEHPDIARIFNNLGIAWFALGEERTANRLLASALRIAKNHPSMGDKHPTTQSIERTIMLQRVRAEPARDGGRRAEGARR